MAAMASAAAAQNECELVQTQTQTLMQTLHKAIKSNNVEEVRFLLASHADRLEEAPRPHAAPKIHAQIGFKFITPWWLCTPLQYAAIHDHEGTVTALLLQAGADVNNCGSLLAPPLHIACASKNKCFVETLIRLRTSLTIQIDFSLRDARGRTAIEASSNREIRELVTSLELLSQSDVPDWQMVEIASPKPPPAEGIAVDHAEGCTCMMCSMKQDVSSEEGSSSPVPIPESSRPATGMFSRIFKNQSPAEVNRQSGQTPRVNDIFVTFDLIEFEDLDIFEPRLARGSFGDVYKAVWNGSIVAVKMLRAVEMAAGRDASAENVKFLQEIRIFEDLRHPNIVGFFGACKQEGRLYFCTEFATAGSLYDFLSRKSPSYGMKTVKQWASDTAHGMDFLAGKNILHRDLKSPNILLTDASGCMDDVDLNTPNIVNTLICKICDFGLAHKVNKDRGAAIGTVKWMAPEAIKKAEITLQSDMYSFGVVLWELITRQKPWKELPDVQVMWVVAELDERLSILDTFPEGVKEILEACWNSEPANRPSWKKVLTYLYALKEDALWSPPSAELSRNDSSGSLISASSFGMDSLNLSECLSIGQEFWSQGIQMAEREMQDRIKDIPEISVTDGSMEKFHWPLMQSWSQQNNVAASDGHGTPVPSSTEDIGEIIGDLTDDLASSLGTTPLA